MPRLLDVSDEVRTEIGDDEADRLLAGHNAPERYDCTSCRTPGSTVAEPTSTVLFVGDETAVLAFAHARCIPSQVVPVSEEQLLGAVQSITQSQGTTPGLDAPGDPAATAAIPRPSAAAPDAGGPHADGPQAAVLGITCGLVLCGDTGFPALVVEPTGPVARPGGGSVDEFLPLMRDHGFADIDTLEAAPRELPGWSVLMAAGELHAVLQPSPAGGNSAWWQAHQPLHVTDAWRLAATRHNRVLLYAAPAGTIGQQPREDLLRTALEKASANQLLVGASMPLAGT